MTSRQWARLPGRPVFDVKGQKIGDVRRVFYDEASSEPAWVTVEARGPGGREAVIPLSGSKMNSSGLAVAVNGELIKDAPTIAPDSDLSAQDTATVIRHYEQPSQQSGTRAEGERPGEAELTRFEEQLQVGTESVETGRARLHKYVEAEPVDTKVSVRHERARVEHQPVRGRKTGQAHRFDEETAEVTLHDEQPVVSKKAVPVETVRLETDTDSGEQRVKDEIRRERIEFEDQSESGRRRR